MSSINMISSLNATNLQSADPSANNADQFKSIMDKIDKNKDGIISGQELQDFMKSLEGNEGGGGDNKGEKTGGGGGGGCGGGKGADGAGGLSGADLMKILDKDGDGKISAEEIKEFESKHGNGDGVLTKEELNAGLAAEASQEGNDTSNQYSKYE